MIQRFGFSMRRHALAIRAAALLLLLAAAPASAQIVYDANMMFGNGNLTYPNGQYTGSCKACIADTVPCPDSTALIIGTTRYTHNVYLNPQLPFASTAGGAVNITHPNFQPQLGSPAYIGNDPSVVWVDPNPNLANDPFFERVCYVGAVGPNDDWTQGWTYYDSTGATRTDLHLPGMPSPRPLATYNNIKLYSSQTWSPDSNYLLVGFVRVKDQATLTVPAGVVIFGSTTPGQQGTLIAERGGKLRFMGTASAPIICTSDAYPNQVRGGWGGVWMLGRAICNCANTAAGDSCASEGGSIGYFGGNNDNDDSGEIHYTRVEYSGYPISLDNELNSFTFDGVGNATQLDHLQAHRGDDDGVEFFGGTVNLKYAIVTDGNDDGYDWQMGSRCKAQFVIVRTLGDGNQTDKGVEADNNEFNHNTPNGPRSNCILSNFTIIGDRRVGAQFPGPQTSGVNFRRGTFGTFVNSIITNFPKQALKIDDAATYRAACGLYTTPTVLCSSTSLGVPTALQRGTLFVTHAPNPFQSRVRVSFTLPAASHARVDVYSVDGRQVGTIAEGDMTAGTHSFEWTPARDLPGGVYFYRVTAGRQHGEGRIVRID